MHYKIIGNDIRRNKVITATIVIFIAAAAMLQSLTAVLIVNLTGAIDTLMEQAETPHFMQMHSGEIDAERLETFAEQNGNVDEYQVLEFLNFDGSEIVIGESSLAGSVQDNGFCYQSRKFDFLLDLEGKVITVSDGECYVPISFMKDGTAEIGDMVVIGGKELTVEGFLRDSQMNSSLASSKRFLISEKDYWEIRSLGTVEYLIEFRLQELSELDQFENDYTSIGLEANGPTITYRLFKFINAISDGLMIAVIFLVSVLIVAIAFLCIRFSLLTQIEEDYREIGVMKAIGLYVSDIKKIYLVKYLALAVAGSILGFALSLVFRDILLENIRLFMGESKTSSFDFLYGIIGVLLVFLAILFYVSRVLKCFQNISPSEAIRFGISQEKSVGAKNFRLSRNRLFNANVFLGVNDVLTRKRLYATMFAVLVVSAFIIILPQNLYNTISSKSFITYMGVGKCDLRIDIQQTDNIPEKNTEILRTMNSDNTISRYAVLTTKSFKVQREDGTFQRMKIEIGDHSVFPLEYSSGQIPSGENAIALSVLNAEELGKKEGDTITLIIDGTEKLLTVCGIYSDITNGGKTAKADFSDDSKDIIRTVICADFLDKSLVEDKAAEYGNRFDFAKVSHIDEFIVQTFGSTMSSLKRASIASIAIALVVTVLITVLFMKMLIAKDRYSIALMKASGFTNYDIREQYVSRSLFVLIIGVFLGTVLGNSFGELLVGAVISSFGASSFEFVIDPLSAFLYNPMMMICMVLIATAIGTSGAGQIKISENIKE